MNQVDELLKSIIDQDLCAVVVCDTQHTIVYMNPAAVKNYEKYGGAAILGQSLMNCHNPQSREKIETVLAWFGKSTENNRVHTFFNEKQNKDGYMIALRDEEKNLIGYYEKHEYRDKDTTPFYEMD